LWLATWVLSVPLLHVVDWRLSATGDWHAMPWLWALVGVVPGVLLVRAWWQRLAGREPHGSGQPAVKVRQGSTIEPGGGVVTDET
jgi:hypothetical protein